MLSAFSNGKATSMVRVGSFRHRGGIQQALDLGADGILVRYVKTKEEAFSCCLYLTQGTRSVYFPQRCTYKDGLLGYVKNSNKNVIDPVQVETADCIKNIDEILALPGLDIAFLGANGLCMSMGLYEKYEFLHMYTSPEMNEAVGKLLDACKKHNKIP
jgi:4-hydroxy-2-oxoheptanedioate aldolase